MGTTRTTVKPQAKSTSSAKAKSGKVDVKAALQRIALAKATKATEADRNLLKPGEYPVRFKVEVDGTIRVGEDFDRPPTVNIPLLPTMALFMQFSGIKGERAAELLVKAMNKALELGEDGADKIAELAEIEAAMANVEQKVIAKMERVEVKGKVTTQVNLKYLPL